MSQRTFSFAARHLRCSHWTVMVQPCSFDPSLAIISNSEQIPLSQSKKCLSSVKVRCCWHFIVLRHTILNFFLSLCFSIIQGWCTLTCKRIKKDQSVGQSIQYTLLPSFEEKFFSDVVIKSCDGYSVSVGWVLCKTPLKLK